jgi:chromosome segregation protein
MRLSQIKLAGFKSFVDPTVLRFPSNLTGVVGPNGCGKSNVIDAVRWVMGESSAKYLRGDSLADVIFNGSSARKPVGVASIELVFDNSSGAIGGPFAKYSEVAVKRTLSRDGASVYYINGTRCRRRDITGLFLGTGLGPRSYSIIEQGMVSRLIEAKPEDTRAYLEEAAGISRYKERRRETENRIRHTRENLERLTDLRDEVEKQLRHLQRQAKVAERYKEYRERERRMQAELTLLRLQDLDSASSEQRQQVERCQVEVDAALAAQRAVETQTEAARERLGDRQEAQREVQERYYKQGAEIARLEQEINHARDLRDRQRRELDRLTDSLREVDETIAADQSQLDLAGREVEELTPALAESRAREQASAQSLADAEAAMASWRDAWEAWTSAASTAEQTLKVEDTRQGELGVRAAAVDRQLARIDAAREALSVEDAEGALSQALSILSDAEQEVEDRGRQLTSCTGLLDQTREKAQQVNDELHRVRRELEATDGRLASLEALQQAALGGDDEGEQRWLEAHSLAQHSRLAQRLQVETGWERAAEMVLAQLLKAVCVDDLDALLEHGQLPDDQPLAFFRPEGAGANIDSDGQCPLRPLASRFAGGVVPASLLSGVYCADTLEEARRHMPRPGAGYSIVTRDGQWLGADWLRSGLSASDARAGIIEREKALREQRQQRESLAARLVALEEESTAVQTKLAQADVERTVLQDALNAANGVLAQARAKREAGQSRVEQIRERLVALDAEAGELQEQGASIKEALVQSQQRASAARDDLATLGEREASLRARRAELDARFEQAREAAATDRGQVQALALQVESRTAQLSSLRDAMARLQSQRGQYQRSKDELSRQLDDTETPIGDFESRLEALLRERRELENELTAAGEDVQTADAELRRLAGERSAKEEEVSRTRESLSQQRLRMQELLTRRETYVEQMEKTGLSAEEIAEHIPEEAGITAWEAELQTLERRIQRLGPINLAAIDEFQTQAERKEYLDAQHIDLTQALETLETAMRKIDKETRTRFKETFDKVDTGLKRIFPRLFGGGHAYLELTDTDLLSAGVTVMARPPGKRNSTIHLLSGGEKAMTAVALIFAIFELNPAPFCMLDEVDAPLDDANVGRFCQIVKEMSERVQFVFITHNKVTMELATHLSGVTMQEPGVSRLVAVDVDEAARLAAM